jgi:MFS family permease
MKKNRLAVNLYFLVNGSLYASWLSRLPKFQEIYQLNNSQTGIMLLIFAIGAFIAMPFAGWLIYKGGSQKITAISAFLYCLGLPFIPIMGSLPYLVLLLLLMGFSTGLMDVAMNAQAVLVEKLYKKPIMSSFHAVFSGGMMLGASLGALFTKWEVSFFQHLSFITMLGLGLSLWSSFNLLEDQRQSNTESPKGISFPPKALWGIGLIAFCCMLGEGAMADWSTNYMKDIALSDAALAPIGLSAFSTAMMLGRIFGDKSRLIFGDGKLLIINSLIALAGISILLLFPSPIPVIVALFLIGLGLSVIVPIAYSIAGSTKGLELGVGISMVSSIGYSGFLFGPPIIGFISDWQNLRIAMTLILVLFLIMTIFSVFHYKRR